MSDLSQLFATDAPAMAQLKRYYRQPLRLFYFMLPKALRQKHYLDANLQQQNHVAACWQQFIAYHQQQGSPHFPLKAKQQFKGDKPIIWQY